MAQKHVDPVDPDPDSDPQHCFPRILGGGRGKNEDYAERNILGWKGLVPLIEIESKNRI